MGMVKYLAIALLLVGCDDVRDVTLASGQPGLQVRCDGHHAQDCQKEAYDHCRGPYYYVTSTSIDASKTTVSVHERTIISEPISYYDMTFSCNLVLHLGAIRRETAEAWMGTAADPQ